MAKPTWLEAFEKNPPTKFPIEFEFKGSQAGGKGRFDNLDQFQRALVYAKSRVPDGPRASINAKKTEQEALIQLFRQVHAHDFFDKEWHTEGMRSLKAQRMSDYNVRKAQEREERQRATWQRIADDARELFDEANSELAEIDNLDLPMLHTIAGRLGSLVTRIKYQTGKRF